MRRSCAGARRVARPALRRVVPATVPVQTPPPRAPSRSDDFEPARKEVETRDPHLAMLLGQRAKAEGDLRALLPKKSNGEPEFELIARAAPRFWQASDPFVLTAGLPVPALQGGASPLECRVSGQTIAGLKVLSVQRYGTVEVTRADLKNYLSSQNFLPPPRDGMPPDFADLMLDALFTDRQRAELLARVYFAQVQKNRESQRAADQRRPRRNRQRSG